MMPTTRSYATAAAQEPIGLDFLPTSQITAVVSVISGALTTPLLQATLDDVLDDASPNYVAPASARWANIPITLGAAGGFVTFDGPWRAIRFNTVGGNTGTTVFQVAQATTSRT